VRTFYSAREQLPEISAPLQIQSTPVPSLHKRFAIAAPSSPYIRRLGFN
jgi:hypothetical protein